MDQDQQQSHHQHGLQLVIGQGSQPRTPQERRRAMLWRERMKLEFQVEGLFLRVGSLVQEWQRLHGSKPAVGNEVSMIASRVVLAGYASVQSHASERQHCNQRDRMALEERRIQQDMLRCSMDFAFLQAQIRFRARLAVEPSLCLKSL